MGENVYGWELGQNAAASAVCQIKNNFLWGKPVFVFVFVLLFLILFVCLFFVLQHLGVEAHLEGLLFIFGSWEWRGSGSDWSYRGEKVTGRGVRRCEREAEPQSIVQ